MRRLHTGEQGATRGRLRALDVATLAAVALVVLLVSLPRLEDLAIRENEEDAARLAQRLSVLAADGGPLPVSALVASAPDLEQRLDDVELLDGGRVLRRHGYLFEVLPSVEDSQRVGALRIWPWEYGRTGRAAFVWTSGGGLLGHLNQSALWSGPDGAPPPHHEDQGWCLVRVR